MKGHIIINLADRLNRICEPNKYVLSEKLNISSGVSNCGFYS